MITANFATHKGRRATIDEAVSSIIDQVDIVRVHYNDYIPDEKRWEQYTGADYTDRAKFAHIRSDEIAFTCDDDLIYPPDYVRVALKALSDYPKSIITFQGRVLLGTNRNYYRGHKKYRCLGDVPSNVYVDVPGSGVSCFNTRDFIPGIIKYTENYMADLLLGLEARKRGIKIVCIKHAAGWINTTGPVDGPESIYIKMRNNQNELNRIADKIYRMYQ
jgi:hypothetical protein